MAVSDAVGTRLLTSAILGTKAATAFSRVVGEGAGATTARGRGDGVGAAMMRLQWGHVAYIRGHVWGL